ncbi:hypothetical protein CS0771_45820 [Catellatospora sp. IY07-71]|uniref:hypothetical protein n=1 Tax=Catellatospora sp. IY07-71 TaxID=2728827 RepID=UPI001BB346C2|nr:hypothetical protein [Catellatospora sp. IY07-71]BCJ75038.1 hypothetical protein CS0771_45820 [Catellatospora sp. IY07-71]
MSVVDAATRGRRKVPAAVTTASLLVAWGTLLAAAPYLPTSSGIRPVALFVHLAAVVLGFGAVLTLDWSGLMWLLGRQDLATLVSVARVVQTPIWLGLGLLVVSGAQLSPDTSSPLTVVKLVAVLAVALNGQWAGRVQERLACLGNARPSRRLLGAAVLVATISQAGWWTATLVGFISAQR